MIRRALITGVNGQDGSYLAEQLLANGYEVHGTLRRSSTWSLERLDAIKNHPRLILCYADLSDAAGLISLVDSVGPDEVYNLAAMSDVRVSFDIPNYAGTITGLGALNVLEAVRQAAPNARFYQAGSSEMFGTNPEIPCTEASEFRPASPYATSKVFAYHTAKNYRDAYDMFVVNGILYNHESERRGVEFVTRKITKGVADIKHGRQDKLKLGNISAKRDWGYAPEYMDAAYRMMQLDTPSDYVIATGETHSVHEFAAAAFAVAGLDCSDYIEYDKNLERPTEVPLLLGSSEKARKDFDWSPSVKFNDLVQRMTEHDLCV
jgi:GDPmannose 4,6-dehydratase